MNSLCTLQLIFISKSKILERKDIYHIYLYVKGMRSECQRNENNLLHAKLSYDCGHTHDSKGLLIREQTQAPPPFQPTLKKVAL